MPVKRDRYENGLKTPTVTITVDDIKNIRMIDCELASLGTDDNFSSIPHDSTKKRMCRVNDLHNMMMAISSWYDGIQEHDIRTIVKLKYLDGRTWDDVANIMGIYGCSDSLRKRFYRWADKHLPATINLSDMSSENVVQ